MITVETFARFGWYCLCARSRAEPAAAVAVAQRVGVAVFAPRIWTRRSRGAPGTEALFPGYLFARFQYPHQVRHVVSCPGVTGLVQFGGEPPVVADGVIDFLRAQVLGLAAGDASPVFEEGAGVRVVAGCFRYVEGRVVAGGHGTDRVRILLSLLGREVQVSLPTEQVVRADPAFTTGCPPGLRAGRERAAPLA